MDRGALLGALASEIRPSRLRCVTLPLDVFRAALAGAPAPAPPTRR